MFVRMLNTLITFFVIGLCLVSVQLATVEQSGERRLIADLMSTYDKRVRPIINVSEAITVTLKFNVLSISELDERKQELKVFGFLDLMWKDEYLTWDPANYNGTESIIVPPGQLWLPDIVLTNSATKMYDDGYYKRFRLFVNSSGLVNWVPAGHISTNCKLNLGTYPFDIQTCEFMFDNWMYNERQVALVNGSSEINLTLYSPNGEWDITMTQLNGNTYVDENGDSYLHVVAEIQLTRKYTFYMVIIVAPSMLISVLSLTVFCLPPDAGERISLGVTVLLSFSVFSLLVSDNLPKTSDSIPLLVIYLTAAMVMAAVSLVITVFTLHVYHHGPRSRVPTWLRFIAFKVIGKLLFFQGPWEGSKSWPDCKTDTKHLEDCDNFVSGGQKGDALSTVEEILKHVQKMTQYQAQCQQDNLILGEWKAVAVVLDRFFCVLYAIGIIIMAVLVLHAKMVQS